MESIGTVITGLRERSSALVVGLSLATVAVTTGFISYTHISALTITENQSWKTAHLMPLTVDGQIAIGSVILMEVKGRHRWWGLVGFLPGLVESLLANWASGWAAHPAVMQGHQVVTAAVQGHNLGAALWSTVPAQAFACSTFLFEMWLRYRRRGQAAKPGLVTMLGSAEMAAMMNELSPQAAGAPAPGPAVVHVHAAPAGAPWGLAGPAAAPVPEPVPAPAAVSLPFPLQAAGPSMSLADRPKHAPRQRAAASVSIDRKPLPADEAALRALVNSMSRNDLWRQYEVSKHGADKLREQYLNEEVTTDVA